MSNLKKPRTPSLRRHKAKNRGYVELDGRRIYLGPWGAPETEQAYHRTVGEWIANGRRLPVPVPQVTIVELCAAHLRHAEIHYRKPDGTPTNEVNIVKRTLRDLNEVYGPTLAIDFGPLQFKALRQRWIERDMSRGVINHMSGTLKRVFKWGVSEGMVEPQVFGALQAVSGLQRGRSKARDTEPVKPVPEAHIEAIQGHVSRQVWALVQLQLLTGARGGELLKLRAIDFDTTGIVWTATLPEHKTSHRGRERVLYFGPRAKAVLRAFMADRPIDAALFSPQEAEAERGSEASTHRRPCQKPTLRMIDRKVGDHYTPLSYGRAIARACLKARVPHWTPHRLRHNAGTSLRKDYGLEAAQVILGHARADVTEMYAERDMEKAIAVIEQFG